jgi:MGT family glycosyltransferase
MTTSRRYLFAIIDGGGTVPADTSVIRAMVERGHDVRVLADRVLAPDVEATGAEHIPWERAPQRPNLEPDTEIISDSGTKTPFQAFERVRDGALTGPAALFAADVRAELRRRPADVVVANFFVFGAQIAAEAEGVPFAFLVANVLSFPGSGTPPLGPGFKPARGPLGRARDAAINRMMARLFDKGLDQLNAARREHGLEPRASVLENFQYADRLLLMTSRGFEYESFTPPPNVRIVGPRLADPAWAGDWSPPPGDDPLVLVGMSSTFMDQAAGALQRVATALGELPVRGLLTTGRAISPGAMDAPANVTVVERAPHSEVLRDASAVVTHGGHGTVIKALAAGLPVVVMPMGRDQLDNAARVEHHGAGLRLKPKASPERIAATVRRVLDEPSFAAGAERMAAAIAADTAEDQAVTELEALADRSMTGGDAPPPHRADGAARPADRRVGAGA